MNNNTLPDDKRIIMGGTNKNPSKGSVNKENRQSIPAELSIAPTLTPAKGRNQAR